MILVTFTLSESGLHSSMPLAVKYLLWNTIERNKVYMIIYHRNKTFTLYQKLKQCTSIFFFYSAYQPASFSFALIAILLKIKKITQASVIFFHFYFTCVDEVKGKTW